MSCRSVDDPSYVPIAKSLNDNQRDALISFAYNCGAGNLKTLCKDRAAAQIAEKILLYNKASGTVLPGLTRRRQAEQKLFNTPVSGNNVETASKEEGEDYNMNTIRKGSSGKIVKVWQVIIGVTPDGIFGSATESATKVFQKKFNLAADGIVGEKSWKAGFESL